ncbi:MAG: hypothetical protein IKG56_01750 [Clostridia bacterium]|nr:hypothetical protein [Clostridia bacterium]
MEEERKIVREIQRISGYNSIVDWANHFSRRGYDFSVKRDFQDRLLRARELFDELEDDDSRYEALIGSNLITSYKCVDMIQSDELKARIINVLINERRTSMDEERLLFALDSNIAYAIAGLKDDKLREEFLGPVTVRNGGKRNLAIIVASFRSDDKRREFMKKFHLDEYDIQSAESDFKFMIGRDIKDHGDEKVESENPQKVEPVEESAHYSEAIVPKPEEDVEIGSDIEMQPENNEQRIEDSKGKHTIVDLQGKEPTLTEETDISSDIEQDDSADLEGMSLEKLEQLERQEDQRISDLDAKIKEEQEKQRQEMISRIRAKREERKQKEGLLDSLLRDSKDVDDEER